MSRRTEKTKALYSMTAHLLVKEYQQGWDPTFIYASTDEVADETYKYFKENLKTDTGVKIEYNDKRREVKVVFADKRYNMLAIRVPE